MKELESMVARGLSDGDLEELAEEVEEALRSNADKEPIFLALHMYISILAREVMKNNKEIRPRIARGAFITKTLLDLLEDNPLFESEAIALQYREIARRVITSIDEQGVPRPKDFENRAVELDPAPGGRTITIHSADKDIHGSLVIAIYKDEKGELQVASEKFPETDDDHEVGHFLGMVIGAIAHAEKRKVLPLVEGITCCLKKPLQAEMFDNTTNPEEKKRH